jgi:hypothetical protein
MRFPWGTGGREFIGKLALPVVGEKILTQQAALARGGVGAAAFPAFRVT